MAEEKKFDQDQTNAINARMNSVVSAGAGSGKTTVLAERFSSLVLDSNDNVGVDQILTLTFTKKATVEMSDRIYKVLKKHAPDKAADFFKANIKTLDSYCNSVAKLGCHYYGISPDFTQDDAAVRQNVSAMALSFLLEHRDNPGIKAVLKTNKFNDIADELFVNPFIEASCIAEPVDFGTMIKTQTEEIVRVWNETTGRITSVLTDAKNTFLQIENYTVQIYKNFEPFFGPDSEDKLPMTLNISQKDVINSNYEQALSYIKQLLPICLIGLQGNAKGFTEFKNIIYTLRELKNDICDAFNYLYGFQYFKAVIPLLEKFQQKINDFKRTSGLLSFKDISNMATCILRDYPEIRQIEKEKYRYIMIDEFQDNNSNQRDLLFMLSEKLDRHEKGIPEVHDLEQNKLFFVGDEKQSIYRFRGADVSVFNALSQNFREGNLSMDTNYRSCPALIAGFNTIFGGFDYPMPNTNEALLEEPATVPSVFFSSNPAKSYTIDSIPDFQAVYNKVKLPEKTEKEISACKTPKKYYSPHIHFAIANHDSIADNARVIINEEAEALWIAEKIIEITTTGINGIIYKPEDIAILMRTYDLQPLYERSLLQKGIPYNTETVTGFFSDGPVNDIFSILRICVSPQDTMAYAQVLRSPWVNLNHTQTNGILLQITENEKPFEQEVQNILDEKSLERYQNAKLLYTQISEFARTHSITQTVTKLWYDYGYRYETIWNKTVSLYSKLYDLIFELARKSEENKMTLAAFVDSVRTYRDQKEKLEDMDIPLEQQSGVHILSIHKSKGLEYPVVFLCATHKRSSYDKNDQAVYTSKKFGITLNTPVHPDAAGTNYFFKLAKKETEGQASAELRRLTYVAMTRAKNELFVTNGKYEPSKNPENNLPEGSGSPMKIFQLLEPVYNYYFDTNVDCTNIQSSGPFTRQIISPVPRNNFNNQINSSQAKMQLLSALVESPELKNVCIIQKEKIECLYTTPSRLHEADDETYGENGMTETLTNPQPNVFKEYDEITDIINSSIPKYTDAEKIPLFSYANFGTIAHAYLESLITGTPPAYSNREIISLEGNPKNIEKIKAICSMMKESFKTTELYKQIKSSIWHKAEYEFKSRIKYGQNKSKIIKGKVDLVFQDKDGYLTVVDYKTNRIINPEIYYSQLACYARAVSHIKNTPPEKIRCILYYLRFNRIIDITKECQSIDICQAVEKFKDD